MTYRIQTGTLADLTPLDVHTLYKLRVDVFVNEQQVPYAEIDDIDAANDTVHFLLWEDSPAADNRTAEDKEGTAVTRLAGTLRIFPASIPIKPITQGTTTITASEAVCQIGRFCFAPDYRATGAATFLLDEAIKYCRTNWPSQAIYLTAQSQLIPYYKAYGFVPTGKEYEEEGQPHQPMILRPEQ